MSAGTERVSPGRVSILLYSEHGSTAQIQLKIPRARQSQREGGVVLV